MNRLPRFARRFFVQPFRWLLVCTLLAVSCQDSDSTLDPVEPTYSSEVVTSWLTMQMRLAQATPLNTFVSPRRFAYTSIALYEAIVPGFPSYQSLTTQLNGMPTMPAVSAGMSYYWPASANAAAATISRSFNTTASAANKAAIDSLEAANTARYLQDHSAEELTRSAEYGRQVAAAVFEWSKTDGNDNTTPFSPPTGPGMWVPTPPAYGPPVATNWGACRLLVLRSDVGAAQGPPIPYSEDPASAYYAQAKEIYDFSQHLTTDQRAIAVFWNNTTWHNVLSQVLLKEKPNLITAAVAAAQVTITMSDATVSIFKEKYRYTGVRPITYIRKVLNYPAWDAQFATPAHPEYPGGHSIQSGAAAEAMTLLFGAAYAYTDTPYNRAAGSPRSYASFEAAATEAALSRFYGGIHYRRTTEVSILQGKIIARNVAQALHFKR